LTLSTNEPMTLLQAHPWFRGIDWENIHRYAAPYHPELRDPSDTKHFDDDIPAEVRPRCPNPIDLMTKGAPSAQPLAPANGAPADATRDPLLRDKVHGKTVLEVRKAYAFAGFTHKAPRAVTYVRADHAFDLELEAQPPPSDAQRGRATVRGPREQGQGRGLSV
jgi:protein-serine/threonine kinase